MRESFFGASAMEAVNYIWPIADLGSCSIGFGVCKKTGMVFQTTVVEQKEMLKYYSNTATYVNPNHSGKPMPGKVNDVKRYLSTIKEGLSQWPDSVLQIGSSDGYTLSCFKEAGSKLVVGVEPGKLSRQHAKDYYGIDCIDGSAEVFNLNQVFDLIVLTHILEHIYDPVLVLNKLRRNLKTSGHLLIEVPLWESLEHQPMGVLTFEHVNYFTEKTLNVLLNSTGFEVVFTEKLFDVNLYPVICILAKKVNEFSNQNIFCNEGQALLNAYIERENHFWNLAEQKILAKIDKEKETYIWGAGIHTSQLLGTSKLKDHLVLNGIFDSSESKHGKTLFGFTIKKPLVHLLEKGTNILISSFASEEYIYKQIMSIRQDLNVVRIYD